MAELFPYHMVEPATDSWRWWHDVLDFVYPPLCSGCGEYVEDRGVICTACMEQISTFDRPFCLNCWQPISSGTDCPNCREMSCPLFAWGDYTGPLRESVIQFKFKGVKVVAPFVAGELCDEFGALIKMLGAEALVPIPLYSAREHARGYNQAHLFALELGRILDCQIEDQILSRVKKRRPQARLSEVERVKNIRGVFAAASGAVEFGRVILIDDVVTSGSTVLEARSVLKTAGYDVVGVISMAHGL